MNIEERLQKMEAQTEAQKKMILAVVSWVAAVHKRTVLVNQAYTGLARKIVTCKSDADKAALLDLVAKFESADEKSDHVAARYQAIIEELNRIAGGENPPPTGPVPG